MAGASLGENLRHLIDTELEAQVWPLIPASKLKPVIFQTFMLEQARQAHELIDSGRHIGKIVLTSPHPG
ncbi:zinc-binding dehydrogenase [Pseudomonas sp. MWU13-2105]|uniref:zinc-binding dehydrogenase n=1 Tax=Pseudomonas sp. MWU13-2105 TaxID=2935074 RepID=UPI00200DA092|nr:zinc-binding dehydrogenase [Pseudomonas sp. MWU13-2105]